MNPQGTRTWLTWLLVVGACAPESRDPIASVEEPVTGLVAAYGFDEASGSTTADASPNRLTGTLSSTTRVAGKFGGGLRFNGSSSWVTVADAAPLGLTTGMTL